MPWHELGISWGEAGLTVVIATVIYLAAIALTRLWGQRQFATSSTYDLAFIFAIGSVIGRVLLVRTSLANALIALVAMFALHSVVGWLHHNVDWVHRLIQNDPILLLAHGDPIPENLRRADTSAYEVDEAIRLAGFGSPQDVAAVILERNGDFSVIGQDRQLDGDLFEEVLGADRLR